MRSFLLLLAVLCLSACGKTQQVGSVYSAAAPLGTPPPEGKTIFLTIDGTGNSAISRTNAARLFEMVDANSGRNRDNPQLATYYAEGVGSRNQWLGLALGNGMSDDIRNAYAFLLGSYRAGDKIYLSGFSRGAYAVRALNGLIGFAGIPEAYRLSPDQRAALSRDLFRAYKIRTPDDETNRNALRLQRIDKVLRSHLPDFRRPEPFSLRVEAMAIWDTVEALGMPDKTISPNERVPQYFIEPCNVGHVFHALALDDNRAYSFTPITAKGVKLASCPDGKRPGEVEEVWFAGAHADVGGSYAPKDRVDSHLPGVSLNWMLGRLAATKWDGPAGQVFEDRYGPIHDAKAYSSAYKVLYRHYRYPRAYQAEIDGVPGAKPEVHVSALQRIARIKDIDKILASQGCPRGTAKPLLLCAAQFGTYGFIKEMVDAKCMRETVSGWVLAAGQQCISVICDPDQQGNEERSSAYCGLEARDEKLAAALLAAPAPAQNP